MTPRLRRARRAPRSPQAEQSQQQADDQLARAVVAFGEEGTDGATRRAQLRAIARLLATSARKAGARAVASGRWLTDVVLQASTHLPARDIETLEAHHRGLSGPLLAEALVRNASYSTGAAGATTGAVAAAAELYPMSWPTLPFVLLAETLVVVSIEMKLTAELHAVAGQPITGTSGQRGYAVARAWTEGRGVRPSDLIKVGGVSELMGHDTRRLLTVSLRHRLMARTRRNLGSFVPFLIGAAAGAELNRRATVAIGGKVAWSLGLPVRR